MTLILRQISEKIRSTLTRGKSVLLLGPRQTGKTTLISQIESDLFLSLIDPQQRQAFELDPGRLTREVEAIVTQKREIPLIIVDEIQKVPRLMDAVQGLIDRKKGQFILTGSSARKLRRYGDVNLLPGRVVALRMDPLTLTEIPKPLPSINELLINGSLPAIVTESNQANKTEDLISYVSTYLEEEIRAEALVRQMGPFSQFLRLAALESGRETNFQKISQDIGISSPTIKAYYEILLDCLIVERIEPIVKSSHRKRLVKTPKYLMYDMGVRRASAKEGIDFSSEYLGYLFEQWVGLELFHLLRLQPERADLLFWRDANGPEVDFVIDREGQYIPIEVKWTENPSPNDARHLTTFLNEYKNTTHAYVVCRAIRKQKLGENIFAIPWQEITTILS